jgi:Uncharacterized alpha/beta hydrolase domain (DUF2235)
MHGGRSGLCTTDCACRIRNRSDRAKGGVHLMKHIFVGIDGTLRAAFADRIQSNVFRLGTALSFKDKNHNPQLFIYGAGVGTMGGNKIFGGAVGDGLEEVILGAYINLVANYEPGDKIYLFGFSRGAVAVRTLSEFLSKTGLVTREKSHLTQVAWQYFKGEPTSISFDESKNEDTHRDLKVEFIGVWDTVVGTSILAKMLNQLRFETLDVAQTVEHAVQILSIDEARKYYHHAPWARSSSDQQTVEQIWLPGVHSDIGGGYREAFLSTLGLFAMIDKISEHCPDISFYRPYMDKLVTFVKDRDIQVHGEGTFYKRRKVGCHVNQSVHPVMELMRGRRIKFGGDTRPYEPTFDATGSNIIIDREPRERNTQVFRETQFSKNSFYSNELADAVWTRVSRL